MAEKLNPDEMTSGQYGEALLQRKYRREEELGKQHRKDANINYAMQVLGGIDQIMVNRAALNMHERDSQLDTLITKERGDYQNLKKEWDAQADWRKAIADGTDPYEHAAGLAVAELQTLPKYSDSKLWGTLDQDDPFVLEFNKHVERLANQKLKAYKKNRVSLPAVSEDVYLADLEALKGQRAPAGLLNFVAEKIGFRDPVKLASIDSEKAKYADDLLTTRRGKGQAALTPNAKADLNMFNPATGHLRKSVTKIRGQGKNIYMVKIDPNGNEMPINIDSLNMKDSVRLSLFPRDANDVVEDVQSYKLSFKETATEEELYAALKDENPRLYREAYNSGLIKGPTNKFSVVEQKNTINTLMSTPLKEGGILTKEQIKSIQHLPAGQVNFFVDEIIRNSNHYSKKGYVTKDGEYVENPDDITAITAALRNQVKGISYAEQEGILGWGEDRSTYDHRKYDINKPSKDQTIDPEAATAFRRELSKEMDDWKEQSLEYRQKIAKHFFEKFGEPLGAEFFIEEEKEAPIDQKVSTNLKLPDEDGEMIAWRGRTLFNKLPSSLSNFKIDRQGDTGLEENSPFYNYIQDAEEEYAFGISFTQWNSLNESEQEVITRNAKTLSNANVERLFKQVYSELEGEPSKIIGEKSWNKYPWLSPRARDLSVEELTNRNKVRQWTKGNNSTRVLRSFKKDTASFTAFLEDPVAFMVANPDYLKELKN